MPANAKPKTTGSKKPYWLEANGELLRKVSLSKAETYDYNRAYDLVPKALTAKPIIRCKARCTTDAIKLKKASTFGAQPPRKVYLYKDIERFYSFANNPGILILGCIDPEKRTRSYEFFRFEDRNVQDIGDIINRARTHPMCILVEDGSTSARYQSSQSSLTGDLQVARDVTDSRSEEENTYRIESSSGILDENMTGKQNEVAIVRHTPEPAMPTIATKLQQKQKEHEGTHPSEYFVPQEDKTPNPIPPHLLSDPLFRALCKNINEDDVWAIDLKYVDSHPKYGSQVDRGSGTYLFVAHHKYPEHISDQNLIPSDHGFENTAEKAFTVSYLER